MNFYEGKEEIIIEWLLAAHDPAKAIIRNQVKQAEYKFFREYIRDQKVLVCGSGLGHDSFELAKYNTDILGVDILKPLLVYSRVEKIRLKLLNVDFSCLDLINVPTMVFDRLSGDFNYAVMNMGTVCNFDADDQKKIISNVMKIVDTFYFSFYPPTRMALEIRQKMYTEEYWDKLWLVGTTIVSEDGLYSKSYTKRHFREIAKELGFKIKFHNLLDFVIMAEVTK
jgi:SAM-dependent methyltransferase